MEVNVLWMNGVSKVTKEGATNLILFSSTTARMLKNVECPMDEWCVQGYKRTNLILFSSTTARMLNDLRQVLTVIVPR
jgi:hypothetical protein